MRLLVGVKLAVGNFGRRLLIVGLLHYFSAGFCKFTRVLIKIIRFKYSTYNKNNYNYTHLQFNNNICDPIFNYSY